MGEGGAAGGEGAGGGAEEAIPTGVGTERRGVCGDGSGKGIDVCDAEL
jgi:hypothetical protein